MRSRQGCFSLLTEMANVLPSQLGEHIPVLIPGQIKRMICYSNTLFTLYTIVATHRKCLANETQYNHLSM